MGKSSPPDTDVVLADIFDTEEEIKSLRDSLREEVSSANKNSEKIKNLRTKISTREGFVAKLREIMFQRALKEQQKELINKK